jgi:hypothetical protein
MAQATLAPIETVRALLRVNGGVNQARRRRVQASNHSTLRASFRRHNGPWPPVSPGGHKRGYPSVVRGTIGTSGGYTGVVIHM